MFCKETHAIQHKTLPWRRANTWLSASISLKWSKKWSSTLLIQLKKQNLIPPLTHWNVAVSIKTNPLIQNWEKLKDNKPWNQGLCEKWSLSNLLDVGTKVTGPNICSQRGLYYRSKDCIKFSISKYNLENCSLFIFLVF